MTKPEGANTIEFDLSKLTAQRFYDFKQAAKADDVPSVAAILAQVCVKCPPAWGLPNDPQTYMKLPMFGEFKQVNNALAEVVNAAAGE